MDKKASIVTFHCVPNYGAVLQAYALQEKLKCTFDKLEIVDYRPKRITKEYDLINFYSVFSVAASLWSIFPYIKKRKAFKKFEKEYLNLSQNSGKTSKSFSDYKTDYLFLGSDQIWNCDITKGFDPVYFGQIGEKTKTVKATYAASIGKGNYNEAEKAEFKRLVKCVDKISVREPEAQLILSKYADVTSEVVVDPTVLAGAECFTKLIKPVKYEKYLLFYFLNGSSEAEALAYKAAKYLGLPIIEVSGRRKSVISRKHKVFYDAGPAEFLSLLYNSKYVVTDSFHGTVFSLLFHKPFLSFPNNKRGGRLVNLLNIAGLSERLNDKFDKTVINKSIDWENVDKCLQKERSIAENYIEQVKDVKNGQRF